MKPDPSPTCCICRQPIPPKVRRHEVSQGVICDTCQIRIVQERCDDMRRMQAEKAESKL